jgi:type II secretory pathway pseudopilin PulG
LLSRVRSEAGVTLPELLIGTSMLVVVMLATFASLDGFSVATRANFSQNQAQSAARTAVDRMARELRGTGNPGLPTSPIERASQDDLVFQTVDPSGPGGGSNSTSVERVRYCLDSSLKLWKQVQTWTSATAPTLPTATACPHTSYGSQFMASDYVVNEASGQNRPVFSYDSGTAANVTAVTVDLYTDTNLNSAPGEQRLNTTVFLRNRSQPPVASFTATPTGSQHVLLNASASSDPDGDDLTYTWYDGSTQIGTGVIFDYASPTTGSHNLSVTVTDPAGLSNSAPVQAVNVT